jgi:hypothetical protein
MAGCAVERGGDWRLYESGQRRGTDGERGRRVQCECSDEVSDTIKPVQRVPPLSLSLTATIPCLCTRPAVCSGGLSGRIRMGAALWPNPPGCCRRSLLGSLHSAARCSKLAAGTRKNGRGVEFLLFIFHFLCRSRRAQFCHTKGRGQSFVRAARADNEGQGEPRSLATPVPPAIDASKGKHLLRPDSIY